MKKIIIPIIILVLFIALGLGIFTFIKSKELKYNIEKDIKIKINTEAYNTDYIKNIKNGKLKTKKSKIDTTKLGESKISLEIEDYFKKIKKVKFTINIYDDEAPIISFSPNLSTTEGTEIDLLKNVTAEDNSKEEIKVEVIGTYDFNKPGTYELKYKAEDSSKNVKEEDFKLEVKKKIVVQTNTGTVNTTFTTSKGFKGEIKNGVTYIDGILIVNKTYSLPSNYGPGITSTTQNAFNKMAQGAALEGINLRIASGYRSYNTQKSTYNYYVNRDGKAKADTYSARPGHSEHQSGLGIDLNTINDTFHNTKEAKWLASNCYKYGFILRYPNGKTNETGYKYESWHFRYVGTELAEKLYNNGDWITLEAYFGITSQYN